MWLAPLLPFTAFPYLLMTMDSAVRHHRGRGAAWKGRAGPEGHRTGEQPDFRSTPGRYAGEPDNQPLT